MGCLNSNKSFEHWFGNIHFSGPCNRHCYFCIGQHMMGLDSLDNLDVWPPRGIDEFIAECNEHDINEVNLTGTNTDPSLYKHLVSLRLYLEQKIPNLVLGIRTNAIRWKYIQWYLFDNISVSIPSLHPVTYRQIMGGRPPNIIKLLDDIRESNPDARIKANIVLCPENVLNHEILETIAIMEFNGLTTINLREPYGQPHIGNILEKWGYIPSSYLYGMPQYMFNDALVTYWDVHYVEVESVNLYASGKVSTTYPITLGYDDKLGKVEDQNNFKNSGRVREQWLAF